MNLLFHRAALGDFVVIFPVLRGLSAQYGHTKVISEWSKAAMAAAAIRSVSPMDIEWWEFTQLHATDGPTHLSPAAREVFERAERIISFITNGRDAWSQNVARLAPQAVLYPIDPRAPADWSGHVGQWHLHQIEQQGLPLAEQQPAAGGRPDGPWVVHPGSGGRSKCWPPRHFESLVVQLKLAGRQVQPILGEVEADTWPDQALQRWRQHHSARLLRCPVELYELLSTASGYVGNDSGPTHLAAQLGVPTIALFGPTNPTRWAPRGPRVELIAPPTPRSMDWLSMERVFDAVTAQESSRVGVIG